MTTKTFTAYGSHGDLECDSATGEVMHLCYGPYGIVVNRKEMAARASEDGVLQGLRQLGEYEPGRRPVIHHGEDRCQDSAVIRLRLRQGLT
jgi:hypothetical protein